MDGLDPQFVISALRRLHDAKAEVFGANGHDFRLNPPLAHNDVNAFESRYRVSLPADYRHFLTNIGNGGAGPFYGVFPLGSMDASVGGGLEPWSAEFIGDLSQPFPHREAWNKLEGMPEEHLEKEDEAEYLRQMDAFDLRYWDGSHVNGAIPICHKGCALRIWLVVSGDEAGHLWDDNRADYNGLQPTRLRSGERATFSIWYKEWLLEALAVLR